MREGGEDPSLSIISLSAWERVEYISIVCWRDGDGWRWSRTALHWETAVYCARYRAGAECRRAKPVGPAGEVSCAGG